MGHEARLMRLGLVASVIKQLEPARAKARDPEDLWDHPLWIAEVKEDEWRFLMHFGGSPDGVSRLDRVYMTGKRLSATTGVLSEKGLCAPCLWPAPGVCDALGYTVLDGGVKPPPGHARREVASFMNVEPSAAAAWIAEHGEPTYVAWDILFYDGQDVRELCLADRRKLLTKLFQDHIDHPRIRQVVSGPPTLEFYHSVVDDDGEGVVLKDLSCAYGEKGAWVKVKKVTTLDVIVTGFTEGRGKYSGMIGSLKCSVYSSGGVLIEVAAVSGMTDDVRRDITARPWAWLGGVVEIEAQEFSADRLLSPQFKCKRPDADPRHATFNKMMTDLATKTKRAEKPEQLSLL